MVGGKGAGKTAALQALARIFGVSSWQRQVQARDFRLRPDETELVSGATRSIECVLSFPELDGLDEDSAADAVPDCFNHMAATGPGETLKARIRLQATGRMTARRTEQPKRTFAGSAGEIPLPGRQSFTLCR